MPTPLNVTIDDSSPLIQYGPPGAWTQNGSDDAFGGSYTSTYTQYASATLRFEGTWIRVNGSRNSAHGAYNITLDGISQSPLNGFTQNPTSFQNSIFESPLQSGPHTLTISNADWQTLDIDSITWTCGVGPQNDSESTMQTNTYDDPDSAFTYSPHGSWDMNPPNLGDFSEKTAHSTSVVNASVNFTFSGDAVGIYGTTGPNNSQFTVQRPDQPPRGFNATRDMFSSQVLLYFGNGFEGTGNHTITLVNQNPGLFQIDYAVVHTANSLPSSSASTPSSTASPTPTGPIVIPGDTDTDSKGLPAGAIVAIAVVALAIALLIGAIWFLLRRNKTLWIRVQRGYMVQSQFDAGTPPNGITPLPYSASPPTARSKATYFPVNDDESFEARPLDRAITMQSQASTLVADNGSMMTQIGRHRPFSLKPLQLASRWGPGTPSSSQAHLSRSSRSSQARLSNARSPSSQHLLREESYDPEAAGIPGIEESPEDRADDVLRHPIRRNEGSKDQWRSALP
ncbi:hypothetical protein C8R44DRAFT_773842 [Mycena epipterygia]|nr:hypothetical protein C8R44DRAFT_773842 [Mycena epipterygia]